VRQGRWDEELLLLAVIELGHTLGWRVAHFRPAQTGKGWRTPVQADAKGWPDLTLLRERLVFAELKVQGRSLRAEQQAWLEALEAAGVECYVWTENDWDDGTIERLLAREPRRRLHAVRP
jgi:hypothetical protein